jgi:DNA-binding IclR family transcriptional regulator
MGDSVSGVGVLDKAMLLLGALESGPLPLADLATATDIPRATAHRLAVALEVHGLVVRDEAGRFAVGPRLGELAKTAAAGRRSIAEASRPAMVGLRDATGESVQLYIVQGDRRVCVASLESPHSLRTIVAVGASLPMDLGSAGKVLRGDPEALRRGWAQSVEERERGVASVSAPVVVDGRVVAAVSVSGPLQRTSRQPGRLYAEAVTEAAKAIEGALS